MNTIVTNYGKRMLGSTLLALAFGSSTAFAQPAPAAPMSAPPAAQAQPWKSIPIPPLHEFKPKEPKRIELSNGLVIYLQEDHELPFIDGTILIRGGSREVPADKTGLVSLYGEAWRTSGSTTHSGDELDEELAEKAASIETGGSGATTSLGWSSFKQDFDTVFGETVDLLLHPAFKEDKLQLAQRGLITSISRRNDDPGGIAAREANKLVYGAGSPYARQAEYATVLSVTLDDLKSWHDRTVFANGIIVAVEGDFDSAAMEAKLRAAFGTLPRGTLIPTPKVDFPGPKPGVYFADKTDINQSTVEIVGLGTERSNPDYYALSVMNQIFSGGFGSRVFQDVRTKRGLAYDVGGAFGALYDHPGVFRSEAGTKSATTVAATKAILDDIEKLKTEPPTTEEMRRAKDQVLNSFIFNFDTPEKTLNEQVTLAFYGYPPDFLDKYKDGIERVTAADVTRVANKYIDVSKLAILVVGNKPEIVPPLSELGKVTDLDISIPPMPGSKNGAEKEPGAGN
ncbi:MAG TPA: pitrilysin family protein [Acidobacteriaceae bacterium]|nr:pitrilysin family protein [Acidobacteriaceae bacterium]